MKVYISGGAKNGKSTLAQNMAAELAKRGKLPLYYVATMIPRDKEDVERVVRHRKERRGLGFTTIEIGRDIIGVLEEHDEKGVFLVDSITALLANTMFPNDITHGFNENAPKEVLRDLKIFLEKAENVIMVSDYIYGDPENKERDEEDYTAIYMQGLAMIDREVAAICDEVYELTAGIVNKLK